jgi:hypothetical protein
VKDKQMSSLEPNQLTLNGLYVDLMDALITRPDAVDRQPACRHHSNCPHDVIRVAEVGRPPARLTALTAERSLHGDT